MFFEKDSLSFRILDAVELRQGATSLHNAKRPFAALSFRTRARGTLSSGKETIPVRDASICLVPAELAYTRTVDYDELYAVHLRLTDYFPKGIESFVTPRPESYLPLFAEVTELFRTRPAAYLYRAAARVSEILALAYEDNRPFSEEKPSVITPSIRYMEAHFRNPDLTQSEVARQSPVSEVYFRRLFRQSYGMSPQSYLIRLRIAEAASLMATGYYSLKEVASLSGYRDYAYFSSEFRRLKGCPPSEYLYRFELPEE